MLVLEKYGSITLFLLQFSTIHCKKELVIFPSPAGMSLTKLSLGGKKLNYSIPAQEEFDQ